MSKAKQLITVLPQRVTEIRSARREAMPRGKGDYISGRVAHVQIVSLRPDKTNPNRVGLIFSLSDFFDFEDTVIKLRGKEAILIKIYRELSPMSQDTLIKVSKCMK